MKVLCRFVVFFMSILFFLASSSLFFLVNFTGKQQEQVYAAVQQQKIITPEISESNQVESIEIEFNQNAPKQDTNKNPLVESFIKRLYSLGLGRTPDASGLAFWIDVLASGKRSGSQIAYEFFVSQEMQNKNLSTEAYIKILYATLLDRESDTQGFAFWQACMNKGCSKTDVLRQFLLSQEFLRICNLYAIPVGMPDIKDTPASSKEQPLAAQTTPPVEKVQEDVVRNEVIRLVNEYRQQKNIGTLRIHEHLNRAAQIRAGEIINVFEHQRPDGRDVWTTFSEVGYAYSAGGENIAICGIYTTSADTAAHIFKLWKNSSLHEENMLDSMFKDIGVGIIIDSDRVYGVQLFGKSK